MEIEEKAKNWDHFKELEYFKTLFNLGQNLFLLGQKYSGKTSLLNECINQKQISQEKILKFNCLIFKNLVQLRQKMVNQIYLANDENTRYTKKYSTFNQLEKVQKTQVDKNNIIRFLNFILILENAENLLEISNLDNIEKFFLDLKFYLLDNQFKFSYQIIIVSNQHLPVPGECFYQFTLTLPSEDILREYVINILEDFLERDQQIEQKQIVLNFIINQKKKLIEDILSYTTIAKDFLSFKTLTENLYELKVLLIEQSLKAHKSMDNSKIEKLNHKLGLAETEIYKKIIQFYFNNFSRIFKPVSEVYEQLQSYESEQRFKKKEILVNIDDQLSFVNANRNFIDKIPKIAQFLLVAFGLADKISHRQDLSIFLGYTSRSKSSKKQVMKTKKMLKKRKYVNLSRVVAIAEVLMARNITFNKQTEKERINGYHTIEFYLNIDFLEKLKLVKKAAIVAKDQSYEVLIPEQLLDLSLKHLGFKPEEYFQIIYSQQQFKLTMKIFKNYIIFLILFKLGSFQDKPAEQVQAQPVQTDSGKEEVKKPDETTAESNPENTTQEAPEEKCQIELLKAYGLQGLEKPSTESLLMFPRITQSCCRQTDQLKIFDQWLRHHQQNKIKDKIQHIENHYKSLIEHLVKMEGIVQDVKIKLKNKNIANCKEIANRILAFEITDLGPQILKNLHDMNEFFFDSFKGFYYTLCDYNNHQFINLEKKEITFSKQFCWNISKNTLQSLIFLYKDINPYLSLVSKFFKSCDANGNYTPSVLPQQLYFSTDKEIEEVLIDCKKDRNSEGWFEKCVPICENFSLTKYSDFFEPQYQKIIHFFEVLKKSFGKYEPGSGGQSLFNNVMPPQENLLGRRRLLEEAVKKEEAKPAEKKEEAKPAEKKVKTEVKVKQPDSQNLIFQQEPGHQLHLGDFNSIFKDEGISLKANGLNTLISKEIYNEIMLIHHDEVKALDLEADLQGSLGLSESPIPLLTFVLAFISVLIQLFKFNYSPF